MTNSTTTPSRFRFGFMVPLLGIALVLALACNTAKPRAAADDNFRGIANVHDAPKQIDVPKATPRAKYVFLFIGDGMGANHVRLAELYQQQTVPSMREAQMVFSTFPIRTFATTHSLNSDITDSAAAGTALATGHKVDNGVVGKDMQTDTPLTTIAEKAHRRGMKVGILSSVSIDHATPACFFAHQNNRSMYYEIAMSLGKSGFAFFGGGGFKFPRGPNGISADAFDAARSDGYTLIQSAEALQALPGHVDKLFVMHPALQSEGEMPWAMEADTYLRMPLADIVAKAIEQLDGKNGFFMMVEAGKIDWASHENDGAAALHEVLAFNNAIQQAVAFYRRHTDETLIVVTADHETGGLGLGNNTIPMTLRVPLLKYQKLALGTLAAAIDDQLGSGASFEKAMAFITRVTGLGDKQKGLGLTAAEQQRLELAYQAMTRANLAVPTPLLGYGNTKGRFGNLAAVAVDLLNQKAGIGWSSLSHTAAPVPVYAIGAASNRFDTPLDNTDIPKQMAKAMGW
ncbi:MAG: alkaline phosphatase [Deltaproteobacteria bacterium]|nr:alkaline phosphatase [Deltaproteobacteria bacterium]